MARLRGLFRAAATIMVAGVLMPACGGEAGPDPAAPEPPPAVKAPPPPDGAQGSKGERDRAKMGGGDRSGGEGERSDPGGGGAGGGSGGSGGSGNPGGSYDAERPDAEGNDVPPPPGSPAERFERTCEKNPRECY